MAKSSSVFWSHADNVLSSGAMVRLPYTEEELRLLLNFHSLFAEHLCVLDISLLYNEPLRDLIMYRGYDVLLQNSIFVPMLRSSVTNFKELEYRSRADETTYGRVEKVIAEPYAEFLDEKVHAILPTEHKYFTEALTENFENSLLNQHFLRAAGLLPIETELLRYIKAYRERWRTEELRRSVFFFFADELTKAGHPQYAARVKWLSSAVYNNTFTAPLNLRPAFPHTYSEALLKILIHDRNALRLNAEYIEADPFNQVSLNLADLRILTARDIVAIRKTSEAKSYFKKVRRTAQESDPFRAGEELSEGLSLYLPSLLAEISSIGTGRHRRRSRVQNKLRLVKWSGLVGSSGIGLVSLLAGSGPIAWGAFASGIIWVFASSSWESKLWARVRKEDLSVYEQWEGIKRSQGDQQPIINVSEMRRGKKAPLF